MQKISLTAAPIIPFKGSYQVSEAFGQATDDLGRLAGDRIEFQRYTPGEGRVGFRPRVGASRPFNRTGVGRNGGRNANKTWQEILGDALVEGFVALDIVASQYIDDGSLGECVVALAEYLEVLLLIRAIAEIRQIGWYHPPVTTLGNPGGYEGSEFGADLVGHVAQRGIRVGRSLD